MMKANEAREITNEAIKKQEEEEKKNMEKFLTEAEKEIKENAQKGLTTCYIRIPEAFKYNEYKLIDTFREYGYGAQIDCFDIIRLSW